MKVADFDEIKAQKNGEITVKTVIDDLIKNYEKQRIKTIASVIRTEQDEVLITWNNAESTEIIGLLECGKQQVIDDMYGQ